jgi:gluconate 2-dehydrogenase gamma chain
LTMPKRPKRDGLSRRTVVANISLFPVSALIAATPATPVFSPEQMQLIDALVNRLIPSDELGPGAREAGVPVYIQRSFSGPLSGGKSAFAQGLAALDASARARHNTPFAQLAATQQDEFLTAMEKNEIIGLTPDSRTFFNRIRQLTFEGMFSDPWYGGNAGYAGWDLIRYPGPRLAVSAENQRLREPIKPLRTSARGRR